MLRGAIYSMKKPILALILSIGLLTSAVPAAEAISLQVNSTPLATATLVSNCTAYVSLRTVVSALCPDAYITWENNQAVVYTSDLSLTAKPGDCYITANNRLLYVRDCVKLINGVTLVPIRVLAKALGASVEWDAAANTVYVYGGSGTITSGEDFYDSSSVYWLSRIINAESCSEPLTGKLAVGNVVLNRVASPEFPDCIYDVIFDDRWGGQFEPVSNGTIYDAPTEESILAAKLCLDGASVVPDCLYFLNPDKSSNFWTVQNCSYVTTIGNHQFYS